MKTNALQTRTRLLAASTLTLALLAACGGGGGSGAAESAGASTAASGLTTTVMDGLIQNALVCVDTNANATCDSGEVQGRTDATGKVTLQVSASVLATARIVAMVGTDAVDLDTGPVTTAYVLQAPAGKPHVVSPLTTLVQSHVDDGSSLTDAEAAVTRELSLTISVYDNYVALRGRNEGANRAGQLARGIVLALQKRLAEKCGLVPSTTPVSTSTGGTATTTVSATPRKPDGGASGVRAVLASLVAATDLSAVRAACVNGPQDAACEAALQAALASLTCPSTATTSGS